MKKLRKVYIGLLIGCIASVATSLFTTFFFQDLFNKFENFTYDMRYKWQYDPQVSRSDTLLNWQPNEDVVVCDIDERSMVKYGVYHKWPRSYHGDVARQLGPYSAVTGFDIIYATMDEAFDRQAGLHSLPAAMGKRPALRVAALLHAIAFVTLALLWYKQLYQDDALWWLAAIGALFVWQHAVASRKPEFAFFTLNGVIGFLVFGFVLAGLP